jgi:hypothetical protein
MAFVFKNNEHLQTTLVEWQKRLRLQDWIITAKIARARDLSLDNSAATVDWNYNKRMAVIKIIDEIDYQPGLMEEQDMEISLVHELLHLHYAGFENTEADSIENSLMEQSIEAISRTLVELKREQDT